MKFVVATGNTGKLREFEALLPNSDHSFIAQSEFGIASAVEDGSSFEENALIKARHASQQSKLPAIADDSGLEVDYLDGAPGIYSARFAGENASDRDNYEKLLSELRGVSLTNRKAQFRCVIVLVQSFDDQSPIVCQGIWRGHITESPSGENGFGYDPVFVGAGMESTSAQLSSTIKNKHSHRARALSELRPHLV